MDPAFEKDFLDNLSSSIALREDNTLNHSFLFGITWRKGEPRSQEV